MSAKRIVAPVVLAAGLLAATVAAPAARAANPSAGTPPTLPQVPSAIGGAAWLAGQLTPSGYVPVSGVPTQPDLVATANTALALAAAGNRAAAARALAFLSGHVNQYVTVGDGDGPGQLALLILDAHAIGVDPTAFGGSDLVSRLLATQQTSGPERGLFGVQDATFDGAFRQGLSLSALAAAGVNRSPAVLAADNWLESQQCPDGGWTSLITAGNPCNGDPADFVGPDTNSTALAVEGLSAQRALSGKAARTALRFLESAQDADGGWGYEPNAADAPGSTDPDSTALVIQAVLALGKSPSSMPFVTGAGNPVSTLLSFQITSGPGSGAFLFPGSTSPDLLATYQSVPAVAGVTDPFDLAITTDTLPGATVRTPYSVTLQASGGAPPLRWRLVSGDGTLPAGLRLNPSSGVISGKPKTAGTSSFAVEVIAATSSLPPPTEALSWKQFAISTAAAP